MLLLGSLERIHNNCNIGTVAQDEKKDASMAWYHNTSSQKHLWTPISHAVVKKGTGQKRIRLLCCKLGYEMYEDKTETSNTRKTIWLCKNIPWSVGGRNNYSWGQKWGQKSDTRMEATSMTVLYEIRFFTHTHRTQFVDCRYGNKMESFWTTFIYAVATTGNLCWPVSIRHCHTFLF